MTENDVALLDGITEPQLRKVLKDVLKKHDKKRHLYTHANKTPRYQRVAVLFVHGMGEPTPMKSVKEFARAVLPDITRKSAASISPGDPFREIKDPDMPGITDMSILDTLFLGDQVNDSTFFEQEKTRREERTALEKQGKHDEAKKINVYHSIDDMEASSKSPYVDFYEYYWAHKMQGTTFDHLWNWLSFMLFKKPWDIPKKLMFLWGAGWLGLIFAVGFHINTLLDPETPILTLKAILIDALLLLVYKGFVMNFLGDVARYINKNLMNATMRDEVINEGVGLLKYLHEKTNIYKEKNTKGVDFETRYNYYDRVIVVGHSLGSLVAFDILKKYWRASNDTYDPTKSKLDRIRPAYHAALAELEKYGSEIDQVYRQIKSSWKENNALGDDLKMKINSLLPKNTNIASFNHGNRREHKKTLGLIGDGFSEEYQKRQLALWQKMQTARAAWRVSDFITLATPLTNANFLISENFKDFDRMDGGFEFPNCPPREESQRRVITQNNLPYSNKGGYSYEYNFGYTEPHRDGLSRLNRNAVFAPTRWTNLYFPTIGEGLLSGIFGDFVGGPLRDKFGVGIKDIEVRSYATWLRKLSDFTILSHTRYWEKGKSKNKEENFIDIMGSAYVKAWLAGDPGEQQVPINALPKGSDATMKLILALDLKGKEYYRPYP